MKEHGLAIAQACRIVRFSRAAYYRAPRAALERDGEVVAGIQAILERRPRSGFWKCFHRLRLQGRRWNHKRVYRVYCALGLNGSRRRTRRVLRRPRQPLQAPLALNRVWAMDFMSDALYGGRRLRTLNVIDEGNREGLTIDVARSIPGARVVRVFAELVAVHGKPQAIRVDNGPEFTGATFTDWCEARRIDVRYIQPGKPDQNAFIERFNRSYREDVLNAYVFGSIDEVREATDEWLDDYNHERPHDSLGHVPPRTFMPRPHVPRESSYELST